MQAWQQNLTNLAIHKSSVYRLCNMTVTMLTYEALEATEEAQVLPRGEGLPQQVVLGAHTHQLPGEKQVRVRESVEKSNFKSSR